MCSAFRLFFRGSLTPCCSYYHCAFRQHDVSTPASSQQTWIAPDIPPIGLRHYGSPGRFQAATEFGRQPSGDSRLGFLCVFYPGSNNQRDNKTCGTYFHCLVFILFGGKKSWTGYNDYAGCFPLETCLKCCCVAYRLGPSRFAVTGMCIFRSRWSLLPPDTVQLLRTII